MSSRSLQNTTPRRKWGGRLYTIADKTWTVAAWVWSAVIIVFLISYAANVAAATAPGSNLSTILLSWLSNRNLDHIQAIYRGIAVLLIVVLISVTLLSLILRNLLKHPSITELQEVLAYLRATADQEAAQRAKEEEAFTQYLYAMKEMNRSISPRGFAQHSRTLILTDIPLDAIFVPLRVVANRPVYDAPEEQQRRLTEIRHRTRMHGDDQADYIQRLRFTWYSPSREGTLPLPLEAQLPQLTAHNPIAVILGAPGSGKTTFLHWLAFHQANASLASLTAPSSAQSLLPSGLAPQQIPILIQTNDYAARLEKEPITFRQFLSMQLNIVNPHTSVRVLDALEQRRCLVLVDGLDDGFSDKVRRQVMVSLHAFIAKYAVADQQTGNCNRFIITSRIADYETGAFASCVHYTLLELDDRDIAYFLTRWWSSAGHHIWASVQGAQSFTEQLQFTLKTHSGLGSLATNPLTLTIMAFMQANGSNILLQRFDLYQMVTRTLLDSWNRESGRTVFSRDEISLAEDVLSRFAYHLQESDGLLRAYDVAILTRQAMAEFYHRQAHEVKEDEIAFFIETLRRSSGLFVEVGDELFCFAQRTFQDYFTAVYLLRRSRAERKQHVIQHYHSAAWTEPLLLMLMYKNRQSSRDVLRETDEIFKAVLDTPANDDAVLPDNLLFVMSSIVNGHLRVEDDTLAERLRERIQQKHALQRLKGEQRQLIEQLLPQLDETSLTTKLS
jgi:hypothetical protein